MQMGVNSSDDESWEVLKFWSMQCSDISVILNEQ